MLEFRCMFNPRSEAVVNLQEELSWEQDDDFVVLNIYDQLEED